ncbi:hypothetical protein BCU90_11090 [Vibrio lentus]|uniref:hypothetical protein n=1 Tax=Vibrio lentus TaxID=136468 RepID=UPI000C84F5CB|nr:hypothetical protein [Vibrio lentus]PMG47593.1 hypothetical protein BCU90_11090 [Vibrio lentus]
MRNYPTVTSLTGIEDHLNKYYDDVRGLVADVMKCGNKDHVFSFHDDHLGLESMLSAEFLNMDIDEAEVSENHQQERAAIVEQARIIFEIDGR